MTQPNNDGGQLLLSVISTEQYEKLILKKKTIKFYGTKGTYILNPDASLTFTKLHEKPKTATGLAKNLPLNDRLFILAYMIKNKEQTLLDAWRFGNLDIFYRKFTEAKDEIVLHGKLQYYFKEEKEPFHFHFPDFGNIPPSVFTLMFVLGSLVFAIFVIIPMLTKSADNLTGLFENTSSGIYTTLFVPMFPIVIIVLVFVSVYMVLSLFRRGDWDY
jgi:hypothetical protein